MKLVWKRYERLTHARDEFPDKPCIYIQTDKSRKPKRVGKASKGLNVRYRGGTGYAIDAQCTPPETWCLLQQSLQNYAPKLNQRLSGKGVTYSNTTDKERKFHQKNV